MYSINYIGHNKVEDIEEFAWSKKFKEMATKCPTLSGLLISALTSQSSVKVMGLASNVHTSIIPTFGTLASVILYQSKPRMFKAFQELNSIQFWLAGCKREVIKLNI